MTPGPGNEAPLVPIPAGIGRVDWTCPTIPEDLALDEALLLAAEEDGAGPLLRLWEPTTYAVILGASGRLDDEVRRDACRADGVGVHRRASGGGTVVLGPGVVNVAVVLPLDLDPRLAAVESAQVLVLERFAAGLRAIGLPVTVRGSGDLTVAGRKVAGSAQRRLRRHVLIHATLLNGLDLPRIARYLAEPRRQPSYREGREHAAFVANLGISAATLREALAAAWGLSGPESSPPAIPRDRVRSLVAERYGDPAWTARF
jgi:lipoate-protein ligase A